MPMTTLKTWLFVVLAAVALAGEAAAQGDPPSPPRNGSYQPTPPESLRMAQRQIGVAVMRLQRARDFGGERADQEVDAGRQAGEQAIGRIDQALTDLQQSQDSDEARQAIRNARLELQSAREALAGVRPESPDAAIQALRDLNRAALEVQATSQVAERPAVGPDELSR